MLVQLVAACCVCFVFLFEFSLLVQQCKFWYKCKSINVKNTFCLVTTEGRMSKVYSHFVNSGIIFCTFPQVSPLHEFKA